MRLAGVLLISIVACGLSAQAQVAPGLAERAASQGSVRVLVELAAPFTPEGRLNPAGRAAQRQAFAAARASAAAALAGKTHRWRRDFRAVPWASVEVDAAGLAALGRSPGVVSVREDRLFRPYLDGTVPIVEGDLAQAAGYDGGGQTIVVIDTGVDTNHPNFAGKLVDEACFASGANGPSGDCPNGGETDFSLYAGRHCTFHADCFHGTHVAGIALGDGPQYDGVAVGADLISIQVASLVTSAFQCSPDPAPCLRIWESDQIAALDHVYDTFRLSHTIAAVNMSLGGTAYTSQSACDSANTAIKTQIDNLRSVDIATVAAAGNAGLSNAVDEPACISSAVSVGAVNDFGNPATWSNSASFLSLWAPGVTVTAPRYQTTGYFAKSGTSMSTPHVAAAWAILRHAVSDATVDEVLAALQATGADVPGHSTVSIRIHSAALDMLPVCGNGVDDDGDGLTDFGVDPGCDSANDASERGSPVCDNGIDEDLDGWADFPDDPGCVSAYGVREDPKCQDGLNNDNDGRVDFDGGESIHGLCAGGSCPAGVSDPDGNGVADPDPQCVGAPQRNSEWPPSSCGLGAELAPLLALLGWRLSRRRRQSLSR